MEHDEDETQDETGIEDEPTEGEHVPEPEPDLPPPADFDLDSWISGVKSTVRSVNVYQRADLMGEIDSLEARLAVAKAVKESGEDGLEDASDSPEEIEDRLNALRQEFVGSGVTFRIQGRSESWLNRVEREHKNHADTNGMTKDEKQVFIQMHQLAGSIIQPQGLTYEHLVALREASEPQIRRLLVTFGMANYQAPAVSVPTSPQSSGRRGARRR